MELFGYPVVEVPDMPAPKEGDIVMLRPTRQMSAEELQRFKEAWERSQAGPRSDGEGRILEERE